MGPPYRTSDSETAPAPAPHQASLPPTAGALGWAAGLAPMADMMPSQLRSAARIGANLTQEWTRAYADALKGVTSMWLAN